MSGAGHLSGPWHWHNGKLIQSNGYIVADAFAPSKEARPFIDVRNEDARLIMAAPDLLDALQVIMLHYPHQNSVYASDAYAAIAKATGHSISK